MSNVTEKQMDSPINKKEKRRWSKSAEANGMSKRVEVEEVDNGYIITISEDGKDPKTGEYEYKTKKLISKENPLNDENEIDKASELLEGLRGFFNSNPLTL